jgi:hypothetical protein
MGTIIEGYLAIAVQEVQRCEVAMQPTVATILFQAKILKGPSCVDEGLSSTQLQRYYRVNLNPGLHSYCIQCFVTPTLYL